MRVLGLSQNDIVIASYSSSALYNIRNLQSQKTEDISRMMLGHTGLNSALFSMGENMLVAT